MEFLLLKIFSLLISRILENVEDIFPASQLIPSLASIDIQKVKIFKLYKKFYQCLFLFIIFMIKGSRVVNVSSSCGHLSKINGEEPLASELR